VSSKANRGGRRGGEHPGGSGAVLGIRLLRFSGAQGVSLALGTVLQMVSVLVVAAYLGPDDMGRYALLIFLASLAVQVLSLPSKPGTIRRVFGGGDDEGDDDDEDADIAASPERALGTGLAWAILLGLVGAAVMVALREPIADVLLGEGADPTLVVWAAVLVVGWTVFKLASIVIWLERRPSAFLIADSSRPTLGLVALIAFLAAGQGLEGAIAGTALGTLVASAIPLTLLRGSYVPCFELSEVWQIMLKGKDRAPIVSSFWFIQNADIFLLSRFISDTDLGIYNLASRTGLVVALLPQGFRIAMRALRKGVAFEAVQEQYGKATAQGQLLGYFVLLSVFAVLVMVLLGTVIVDAAPPEYADAAGLIPFCAAGFVMSPLLRTVNGSVSVSHNRAKFISGVVGGALVFAAVIVLLAPEIGAYAAPLAMLIGLGGPATLLFVNGQVGKKPLKFPYSEVMRAIVLAAVVGGAFQLLPELPTVAELSIALVLIAVYLGLLVVLRVVPAHHWGPLLHMARSLARGTPVNVNPRKGLRAIDPADREELRVAVIHGLPAERLAPDGDAEAGEGEHLVHSLRLVGENAGVAVGERTGHDLQISVFLFEDAPPAVRDVSMGKLLDAGASASDLRALEDLVSHLARVPDDAWEGHPAGGRRLIRRRAIRRRRARGSASRNA
jgi:O-antigen/teichoic acid export membrane protein